MPSRRSALLVATYRYQDATLRQLTAPAHDAEALAEVLRNPEIANFDVTILINEPHHVVLQTIGDFITIGAVTISRCCTSPAMG